MLPLTTVLKDYAHFACTAIHNGHRLRPELLENCALDDAQRLREEDPWTADIAANMPITVVANDSRYEYDLNRTPETCVYEEAWGQAVWKEPLSDVEKAASVAKHNAFYTVLGALYEKLESLHPQVLAYDVHSYNCKRPGMGDVPLFNIGTEQLDTQCAAFQHRHRTAGYTTLAGGNRSMGRAAGQHTAAGG
jgi:N-formylglutamate amidohydrolase